MLRRNVAEAEAFLALIERYPVASAIVAAVFLAMFVVDGKASR